MSQIYELDDPTVEALGAFLQRAPLANGTTTTGLASPTTELLAQAILNFGLGFVFQDGSWIPKAVFETTPDLGDVEVEPLGDGSVYKLTQRSTGLSALGETPDEAWAELRKKAVDNG